MDALDGLVGAAACVGHRAAQSGDVQHPPTGGDQCPIVQARSASVGDEHAARDSVEARDDVPLRGGLRIASAREHDRDGRLRCPVEFGSVEATGDGRALEQVEQIAAQAREDRLRLRIAEADIELEHLWAVSGQHQPGV